MRFFKPLLIIFGLVALTTTAGVFSTWEYAGSQVGIQSGDLHVSLIEWVYLPGTDGDDTVDVGENHNALILAILEHTKQGLNFSDFLINGIDSNKGEKDILHSQQNNISGGTPKKFFSTGDYNTQNLDFVIQRVVDAEVESYYVYTFEDDDLVGTVGESWVPCYQILLEAVGVVNGRTQYEQIKVKQGRATLHIPKGYSFLSINPLNWEEVKNNT